MRQWNDSAEPRRRRMSDNSSRVDVVVSVGDVYEDVENDDHKYSQSFDRFA